MVIGLGIEDVPMTTWNRVKRVAKAYGWKESDWPTKRSCRVLARAMRDARDRLMAEGLVTGLDELDRAMHRLCSALGLKPAQLVR